MNERQPLPHPWQQVFWNQLQQQAEENRFPHALLLQGVVDCELDSFALLLAHALLCDQLKNGLPCGQCRSCHLLSVGSHPNFEWITLEPMEKSEKLSKVIKIEQIRAIMDRVQQTTLQAGRKVLVIFPAEAMNPNAANALLKSLEEPPPGTIFILATNNPCRLMATIRSRCQLVEMPLPSPLDADSWLAPYIKEDGQRRQLLMFSGHNPLLARRWQQQGVVEAILNLGTELQQIQEGRSSPLQVAAQWHKSGVLAYVVWWWRWLALQVKQDASSPVAAKPLLHFMDKLLLAKNQLESTANPNEQLLLESLLIDWQNLRR